MNILNSCKFPDCYPVSYDQIENFESGPPVGWGVSLNFGHQIGPPSNPNIPTTTPPATAETPSATIATTPSATIATTPSATIAETIIAETIITESIIKSPSINPSSNPVEKQLISGVDNMVVYGAGFILLLLILRK